MRIKPFLAILLMYVIGNVGSVSADHQNNLLPNIRFGIAPTVVGNGGAAAFAAEAGPRNFRGSGTYGLYLTPCQRVKMTVEALTQNLDYHFTERNRKVWVPQCAVGGEYQYLFPECWFQRIDLGGSFSHASSRHSKARRLNARQTIRRDVAGSDGAFAFLGSTLELWCGSQLTATGNYDYVKFKRHYEPHKELNGFGGSVKFIQQFAGDIAISLQTDIRRVYNFYEITLNCKRSLCDLGVNFGLYGNYTDGKKGVPDVAAAGIQISLFWDDVSNRSCIATSCQPCCSYATPCDTANWVSTPAVYIPVVLAIRDQKIKTRCNPPSSTTIPDQSFPFDFPFAFDISSFFTGEPPLTFSATGLPPGVSIDSSTGIISGTVSQLTGDFPVSVIANTACGSTIQSFILTIFGE